MKKIKLLFALVLMLVTVGAFAQTQTKVYAVITKADWCPTCKEHGTRVVTEVLPLYKTAEVKMLINDLTDAKTKASSKEDLKQEGIGKPMSKSNTTGEITFINAKTKKVISKISVAKSNDEIKYAFDQAILKS